MQLVRPRSKIAESLKQHSTNARTNACIRETCPATPTWRGGTGAECSAAIGPGNPDPVEAKRHPLRRPQDRHRLRAHGPGVHDVELRAGVISVVSVRKEVPVVLSGATHPWSEDALAAPAVADELVAEAVAVGEVILDAASDGVEGRARSSEVRRPDVTVVCARLLWVNHRELHMRRIELPLLGRASPEIEGPLAQHGGLRLRILEGEALRGAAHELDGLALLPGVGDVEGHGAGALEPLGLFDTLCVPREHGKV
mmetsp:Transcript_195/g.670  ORF Transcript_195/g.670 Transcript_195/m.670 type:complete len:255 (-) Transcript_195:908-1672(-)